MTWLLESVSLPLLFQPLSLYLHLLSSVSFPKALILSPPSSPGARGEGRLRGGGGQASSASIFLIFPSLVVWLSLSPPQPIVKGLATSQILVGSCPDGLGLQLGHPPVASLEIHLPKVGKLRGGKDAGRLWEELVARVTRGTSAHFGRNQGKPASCLAPISPGEQVRGAQTQRGSDSLPDPSLAAALGTEGRG